MEMANTEKEALAFGRKRTKKTWATPVARRNKKTTAVSGMKQTSIIDSVKRGHVEHHDLSSERKKETTSGDQVKRGSNGKEQS